MGKSKDLAEKLQKDLDEMHECKRAMQNEIDRLRARAESAEVYVNPSAPPDYALMGRYAAGVELETAKQEIERVKKERDCLLQQIDRLRNDCQFLKNEENVGRRERALLREEMEKAKNEYQALKNMLPDTMRLCRQYKSLSEMNSLLKAQCDSYEEDFKHERRDRELMASRSKASNDPKIRSVIRQLQQLLSRHDTVEVDGAGGGGDDSSSDDEDGRARPTLVRIDRPIPSHSVDHELLAACDKLLAQHGENVF